MIKKINKIVNSQKPHLPQANVIGRLELCKKCQGVFNTNEAFGMAYVLDTYLDFASEAKEDFVKLSIDEVTNIIKLLKQVSV